MTSKDNMFVKRSEILIQDNNGNDLHRAFNIVFLKLKNIKTESKYNLHDIDTGIILEKSPNERVNVEISTINSLTADIDDSDLYSEFYALESTPELAEVSAVKINKISISLYQGEPINYSQINSEVYKEGIYNGESSIYIKNSELTIYLTVPFDSFNQAFEYINNNNASVQVKLSMLSFKRTNESFSGHQSLYIPISGRFNLRNFAYLSALTVFHNPALNQNAVSNAQVKSEDDRVNSKIIQDFYKVEAPQFQGTLNTLKASIWIIILLLIIQILKS